MLMTHFLGVSTVLSWVPLYGTIPVGFAALRKVMEEYRILVVDDFEEWRRMIYSILGTRTELQIVAEAADGQEAVQKAGQLNPDVILLDIGLPKLNGMTAARLISEVSPTSKILFVSETNDPDLVQGALNAGA